VPELPWRKNTTPLKGPVVVQLATCTHALVVHLTRANGRPSRACIPCLQQVLSDAAVVKVGCGIDDDMIELYRKWGLHAVSRFELGGIGVAATNGSNEATAGVTMGLKALVQLVLGRELVKSRKMAMSNWGAVPLSEAQVAYSARDAWAGAAVVHALAQLDSDTFGTPALVQRLKDQPTICELDTRQRRRKEAKNRIAAILEPFSLADGARKKRIHRIANEDNVLPSPTLAALKELRQIVAENRHDRADFFDLSSLGLLPATNGLLQYNLTHAG
jgi:ribonuclease D